MSSTDFRITGIPEPSLTASISGAGLVVASPGAIKYVAVYDVLASEQTTLRLDSTTGSILFHAPAGASNLTASITGGVNNAIYNTTGNVTVTYSNLNF